MDLINQFGISYNASYLLQGNQLEKCKLSTKLHAYNTEFKLRSDGKDFDISSVIKDYRGNIIFHVPTINADSSNLKTLESKVKNLVSNDIKMITISASNLLLSDFEWSTLEEQKEFFANLVTGIAKLAGHKIIVAVENENSKENNFFGSNIEQVSDIIVYARKVLVRNHGFSEEEASECVGLCLNVDNVIESEGIKSIDMWINTFNKNIKCIKFSNKNNEVETLLDTLISINYENPILMISDKELEEIEKDYTKIQNIVVKKLKENKLEVSEYIINEINDNGYSNIIVVAIIVMTFAIAALMVYVKLKS